MNQMEIKYRRLDTIHDLPGNAKLHDENGIRDSISEFGFIDALGVNPETMHNLDGNGRLTVLKTMYAQGEPAPKNIIVREERVNGSGNPVPVWYVPTVDLVFDAETESIVALRLNRTNQRGGQDDKKVYAILEQASLAGRLHQTGYDQALLENLAQRYAPPPSFVSPVLSAAGQPATETGRYVPAPGQPASRVPGFDEQYREGEGPGAPAAPLPPPPLAPSHVRMVQLFLNAETQPLFTGWCQAFIQAGNLLKDDNTPANNLTDIVFCLVRDAYTNLTKAGA